MLDDEFPKTPIVVGRLRGGEPGPTVVLNGHLDTVPIPHEWPRLDGETIYGRGTADMKGALACAAEAARVLAERGSFPGELVIVAIGLHEAPGGRGEDLTHLLERARLHGRPRSRLRARRPDAAGRAPGLRDVRDHDPPRGHGHARAADGRRHAQSDPRRRQGDRGDPRAQRGAGRGRARVGRPRVVLPRRGARRRLLQPPPGRVPARRHAPLGAGEHAGAGGGGVPGAAGADRGRVRLRDRPRPAARARRVRDRSRAPARGRAPRGVPGRDGRRAAARPASSSSPTAPIFNAAGIPTVYHGPMGTGAHGDVESIDVAELVRATQVYLALLERLWA